MSMMEPQKLMDVLGRLESATSADVEGPSRRRFRRFTVRDNAQLEPLDEASVDEPLTVLLRDVSRGGIGFLTDRFLQPNTFWRVRFMSGGHVAGSQPIVLRYCRLVQEDLYLAGGQFIIEPFIMHDLGIGREELEEEDAAGYARHDISRFLAPEDDLLG